MWGGRYFEIDWIRGSDGDLDGDGIPDGVEGSADSDNDGLLDLEDLDSDNDGLPDALENALRLSTTVPINSSTDSDGDGQSDLLEITAGTNHLDRNDHFTWSLEMKAGSPALIHLQVKPGRSYFVEGCQDPAAHDWQVIGSTTPTTPGEFIVTDPESAAARRFYRVRIALSPGLALPGSP